MSHASTNILDDIDMRNNAVPLSRHTPTHFGDFKHLSQHLAVILCTIPTPCSHSKHYPNTSLLLQTTDAGETVLLLVDLGAGKMRMGASVLGQVYNKMAARLNGDGV